MTDETADDLHDGAGPERDVLAAFGLMGPPSLLPGGQGRSWRCGGAVLKPAGNTAQAAWAADVLSSLEPSDVTVPSPLAAHDGRWVVDGWTAMRWVEAEWAPGRWTDIIAAGRVFHRQLAAVPRPGWMDLQDEPWWRSAMVAFDGRPPSGEPTLVALVKRLLARCAPLTCHDQVVHGDLTGNVLFDPHGYPVIIDVTPYWRPPEWASAIVAVDALEWEGAGPEALDWLGDVPDADQLLLRAAIYRIATSAELAGGESQHTVDVHSRTVAYLEDRC